VYGTKAQHEGVDLIAARHAGSGQGVVLSRGRLASQNRIILIVILAGRPIGRTGRAGVGITGLRGDCPILRPDIGQCG